MRVISTGVLAAMAAGVLGGCPTLGAYLCTDDSDCDRALLQGVCLSDGACAYPDPSAHCDSGLVRSPNAELQAGQCVPLPSDDGETGGGDAGSTTASATDGDGQTATGPTSCGERVVVSVNTAAFAPLEPVPGYPLYLRVTEPQIVAALAGQDVWITDSEGTPLAMELEPEGTTADAFAAWVSLPDHEAAAIIPLEIRWGATAPANDPSAVWSAYAGVWHFDTIPSGFDQQAIPNSAEEGEPGRTFGTMLAEQAVTGMLGSALRFDGIDDRVEVEASYVGSLDAYTISFWARYEGTSEIQDSYFERLNGDAFWPRCWRSPGDGTPFCQYSTPVENGGVFVRDTHAVDTWIHLAMQRDPRADESRIYFDGPLANTNPDNGVSLNPGTGNAFVIGSGEWGSFPGTIDEIRVSTGVIPANWIAADAAHQRNPSAALTVGAREPQPCG